MKTSTGFLILSVTSAGMLLLSAIVYESSVPFEPCETDDETVVEREFIFNRERFTIPIYMKEVGGYHKNFFREFSASFTAARYVTVDDPTIQRLMSVIEPKMDGMSNEEKAASLLRFVQANIRYESDSDHFGKAEYIMFPAEVLLEGYGDCEDSSILLKTLYDCAGLDSVFIFAKGHVLLGVAGDFKGDYVFKTLSTGSTRYYLADSTIETNIGYSDIDGVIFASDVPLINGLIAMFIVGMTEIATIRVILKHRRDE